MKGEHFNGVVVPGGEASEVPAPSIAVHTPSHKHRVSVAESPLVVSDTNVPIHTGDFVPLHSDTSEGGATNFKIFWWRGGDYRNKYQNQSLMEDP